MTRGAKLRKVKKIYPPLTALNLVSTYVEYFMYGNECHPTLRYLALLANDRPLPQALSKLSCSAEKGTLTDVKIR